MRQRPRIVVLGFRQVLIAIAFGALLNRAITAYSAVSLALPNAVWQRVSMYDDFDWPGPGAPAVALPARGTGVATNWPARLETEEVIAFDPESRDTLSLATRRDGWPWPALAQDSVYRLPHIPRWLGQQRMIPLSDGGPRIVSPPELTEHYGSVALLGERLPYLPVWRGLIGNTLLFALVALPIVMTPGVIVRWRRVLPGHCAACGYDVTGLAICPECGARRPSGSLRPLATPDRRQFD